MKNGWVPTFFYVVGFFFILSCLTSTGENFTNPDLISKSRLFFHLAKTLYFYGSTLPKMPYIPLDENLPGITGLLNYRLDTALPIRNLTQILLRGESTLTEAERELIAAAVSFGNGCKFCTVAHSATADLLLGEKDTSQKVKYDLPHAPVSEKMKALLEIAGAVQVSGKSVTSQMVENARLAGATDLELHDTVLIAALFSLYNRYVDGLASVTPADSAFYERLASILVNNGYLPSPNRYDSLKKA